jgi:hypothetical protein
MNNRSSFESVDAPTIFMCKRFFLGAPRQCRTSQIDLKHLSILLDLMPQAI